MTAKQEKILQAALELFAKEGFRSTSTNKVARKANVSEGLIFRHFKNKEGLLEAVIQQGEDRAKVLFADIVKETDPKSAITKYLQLSNKMANDKNEADFWKLQYKIKWELEKYGAHKMEPIIEALTNAFKNLNYPTPRAEANQLIMIMDGMATQFFLNDQFDFEPQISLLKLKYGL